MKDDDRRHYLSKLLQLSLFRRKLFNLITNHKFPSCFILLLLTYALGYFSAYSSSPSSSFSSSQLVSVQPTTAVTPPLNDFLAAPNARSHCPVNNDDHFRFGQRCAKPVPAEEIRRKILDGVFNGTSPYESFPPAHLAHLLRPKRVKGWGSYGSVFETLIQKVRPQTIIEVGTFLGASAIHMSDLSRKLGLDTQILCLDDFRGWPGFRDRFNFVSMQNGDVTLMAQFLQNVISSNATRSILPVPFSTGSGLQKLCDWGVLADLIEVDAGHDFHSAWTDINQAHKLLRRGGVIFGHDYHLGYDKHGVRRAVDLFAQVNGFKIRVDGQHWVVDSS